MLWGDTDDDTSNWAVMAQNAITAGSDHLLGFNEPDLNLQSNIAPDAAATAWKTHMEPFAGKATLVSPAITNGAAEDGLGTGWLSKFFDACTDCHVDVVAMHWYATTDDFLYFQKQVEAVHTAAGDRKVWLTEFGASGTEEAQVAFLEQAVPYLESLDFMEHYAYFMVSEGTMLTNGAPNAIAKAFAS